MYLSVIFFTTYCISGTDSGKLLALFPCTRSMLKLQSFDSNGKPNVPESLAKRLKDMPRIFRNKVKNTLTFKINSNFDMALHMLRVHHGDDCWVSPQLEEVWRRMQAASPPSLLVFELWYGDHMIAADFAHPSLLGRSVYVATRFFDRREQYKHIMPGFMLAAIATKYLRAAGCSLWDLGGVNLCPLMRYKHNLTGPPLERLWALHEFRELRDAPSPMLNTCVQHLHGSGGVAIASVALSDVLL